MTNTISYMLKTNAGQILGSMAIWLRKSAEHARAHEVDDSVYMAARLYPDMFAMDRQVQICTDMAARGGARLAGLEPPAFPDQETTLAQLAERAERTLAFIQGLDDAALDAQPEAILTMQTPRGDMQMPKLQFMSSFVVPNVIFHATTAYGLLRMQGVPLGKFDFLAGGQSPV